jgi:hypothetical protein
MDVRWYRIVVSGHIENRIQALSEMRKINIAALEENWAALIINVIMSKS